MKLLVIIIILTFIAVTGLTMFFTGTYKRFLHRDDELDAETAEANGEIVESEITGTVAHIPDRNETQQPEILAPEDNQVGTIPHTPDREVEDRQHTANTTALEEEKLQAQLLEYKEQIVAAEKELTAIKVEIESLKKQKTSITAGQQLAKIYGSMKSDGAASILCELDEDLTKQILSEMNDRTAGKIMDAIVKKDPSYAASISKLIADSYKPWFP